MAMNAPIVLDPLTDAECTPLDQIDVSDPKLYQNHVWQPYFARLRREEPVHWRENGMYGSFWSITKYQDIMDVETRHQEFSSETVLGGIMINDRPMEYRRPSFISTDPPKHTDQRRVVAPTFTPTNMQKMALGIRERVRHILDSLPRNEVFDWVDLVSVEVTTQMLATLFDFPFEQRRKLTFWSDVAIMDVNAGGIVDSEEKRLEILAECLETMTGLWRQREKLPPRADLISMMAHGEGTHGLPDRPMEFLGNLILLIVGGNDTTRNSISGGLWALHSHPDQWEKLRENQQLIPSFAQEAIRWQSPIIHMRRTALCDAEVGGKHVRKGDKVVMWYVSGNRDETAIPDADRFIIDREKPRQHLAFGYGIHRCVGARLAELQLSILWEEILARDFKIEVMGEPKRLYSNFIGGISSLPVRIAA
jgi:cytochrome P450